MDLSLLFVKLLGFCMVVSVVYGAELRVCGVGHATKRAGEPESRTAWRAREGARIDGYKQLLEFVQGVYMDNSAMSVDKATVHSDSLKQSGGLMVGSRVIADGQVDNNDESIVWAALMAVEAPFALAPQDHVSLEDCLNRMYGITPASASAVRSIELEQIRNAFLMERIAVLEEENRQQQNALAKRQATPVNLPQFAPAGKPSASFTEPLAKDTASGARLMALERILLESQARKMRLQENMGKTSVDTKHE
jgi:hypothetical protein